jgi:hypothetical protein
MGQRQKQRKIGSGNQSHDKRTETTDTTGPVTETGTGIEMGTKKGHRDRVNRDRKGGTGHQGGRDNRDKDNLYKDKRNRDKDKEITQGTTRKERT